MNAKLFESQIDHTRFVKVHSVPYLKLACAIPDQIVRLFCNKESCIQWDEMNSK